MAAGNSRFLFLCLCFYYWPVGHFDFRLGFGSRACAYVCTCARFLLYRLWVLVFVSGAASVASGVVFCVLVLWVDFGFVVRFV